MPAVDPVTSARLPFKPRSTLTLHSWVNLPMHFPRIHLPPSVYVCRRDFEQRLDGIAGSDPFVETAMQGAHALEASPHECARDLCCGRLIRTGAIKYDFAIARQAGNFPCDLLERDIQRTVNPARLE